MSSIIEYESLIAFHPSEYVKDIIEDLNITQEEFANRLGISPKVLSEFLNAKTSLSPDLAYRLESLTGVSYDTWMNLEIQFDKKKLEIEKKKKEDEKSIIDSIDIGYFKEHNLIENKRYSFMEKERVIKKLLNIADIAFLGVFNPMVSYRNKSIYDKKSIINSNIMLEIASNIARNATDNKLDKKKLKKLLPEIKKMTNEDLEVFYPRLKKALLNCGVILVALPHLTNSGLHGAIKKFKNGSVMLLITDKNKSADIFWFSLVHEIFHILNGDFKTDVEDEEAYVSNENYIDNCTKDFFIPTDDYKQFIELGDFSESSILNFADKIGINPGILIGRLKKEKVIPYSYFQNYNKKYCISVNI